MRHRSLIVVLCVPILVSSCFGLASSYQLKQLARIRASYRDQGIRSYREVPLVPVAFLVDKRGNRIPYIRDGYENPDLLLKSLNHKELKVAYYVVAEKGKELVYSEQVFMQALAHEVMVPGWREAPQHLHGSRYQFSRWWHATSDVIVLLTERVPLEPPLDAGIPPP